MNDDFLYKFRKPPRRDFAAALYQRISNGTGGSARMKPSSRTQVLRTITLAFSMVAVMTAVLFFSPSTHALAQSIIRQFGGYIFVQGTPQSDLAQEDKKAAISADKEQKQGQPHVNEEANGTVAQDAAAASQLAGFTVLAPSYVPDGYTPGVFNSVSGGWLIAQENGGVATRTTYVNQATGSFLTIEELKYEQGQPRTVERPEIVEVTVRGQAGVWMPDNDGKNVLVWEENGITYLVVSNTLSQEEHLKVAESLGK